MPSVPLTSTLFTTMHTPTPTRLSFTEKIQVRLWRVIMAILAFLGGKRMPKGSFTSHSYGTLHDEALDILLPAGKTRARTAVVNIHGGGWITGSKGRFYTRPLLRIAAAGHTVYSLNYPLAPEHPHPQALNSILKALAWIKAHHPEHDRVHLIGDSAGGNLAMMAGILVTNPELLKGLEVGDVAALPGIASISSFYGVLDRTTWLEDGFPGAKIFLKSYAGEGASAPDFRAPVPVTPADLGDFAQLPPTWIVGASEDRLLRSSAQYAAYLTQRFPHATYQVYPGAAHGFFNFGKQRQALGTDLQAFLDQHD
jgi:acetyl esterase/lipase